jgi:hypothetical protein
MRNAVAARQTDAAHSRHDTVLIPSTATAHLLPHNHFMLRFRVLALCAASFLVFDLSTLPLTLAASRTTPPKIIDSPADYASALQAADRFLQAWQSGDTENGIALLTSRAKQAATTDGIDSFFSTSTPCAYEIGHGKLVKNGRYKFPVVLLGASKNNHSRRRSSSITVLHSGGDDWAVDKLP